jgi:rhodanese-related sulfurtransferase
MKVGRQMALLALASLGLAVLASVWHPHAPAWRRVESPPKRDEVDAAEIPRRWPAGVLWLDARPRKQYESGHIPGALPLGEADFDGDLLAILDALQRADRPVILYCDGARCETSRRVRERLLQMVPLDQCFILRGGYGAWKQLNR